MKVDIVAPGDLGESERRQWAAFQDADDRMRSPFQSVEFTLAAARHRPRTRVAVISDGGEVVGFLPFERGPLGEATSPAAVLNEGQGVIHRQGYEWDARELLDRAGIGVWEFDQVVGSPTAFEPYTTFRAESPAMDLTDGFETYLAGARARSSRIKDLSRRRRRLGREHGPVRFEFAADDPVAMRRVMAWKSDQYRRTARPDRFAEPWIRALVEDVATLRTPGCSGVVSLVWAGDTLVAGHVGLRSQRVLPTWFPAYDPDFSRYSPGLLLHVEMAEAGAADGLECIDLGRGPKDYKDWLADHVHEVWEGRVVTRTGAGLLHWARRVPLREVRNTVVSNRRLYDVADRTLRTYASVKAAALKSSALKSSALKSSARPEESVR